MWKGNVNGTFKQSFIKRQTRNTSSDNERQRVVQQVKTSGTTSDNECQRVTTNDNEWQRVVILADFSFARIKGEPTTMHPKETL